MVDVSSPNWHLHVLSRLLNEGMVEHEPECDGIDDLDPDEECDCIVDDLRNLTMCFGGWSRASSQSEDRT
jgi:hypothetical protein